MRFELRHEPPQCLERSGEHQQARDLAVQPVHRIDLGLSDAAFDQRIEEPLGQGRGLQVRRGHRQEPRILLYDEEVLVLEEDPEPLPLPRPRARLVAGVLVVDDLHPGAGGEPLGALIHSSARDLHAAGVH